MREIFNERMKLKEVVDKSISKIRVFLSNMNSSQKLLITIIFAALVMIVVKLGFENNSNLAEIDYKVINGEYIYIASSVIDDNDVYVTLKSISDDFISICQGYKRNQNLDKISVEDVYNGVLTNEYKKSIKKKKFKERIEEFTNKINLISENNLSLIPDSITEYKENYYLVRYESSVNDKENNMYLGIMLDSSRQKYYIWYVE